MLNASLVLKKHNIRPTMHRLAVAKVILTSRAHPSAEEVWISVKAKYPAISRATVYNTLDLFAEKGLLRRHILRQGTSVYDPAIQPHHHLVEEETGHVYDIPWNAVRLPERIELSDFEVTEFHLVIKGKKKRGG
ncbi:MAG TPA: hypothetical protein DEF68_04075 [Elusimicrobia bacterium]|nr:hypothetical protein [Elusimicrobiota bacterium]